MFVIKYIPNRMYFHQKQKIILFREPNEAAVFLDAFRNYSLQRLLQEQKEHNPFLLMEAANVIQQCQILPIDFDINDSEVKTIWFHEIEKN